jgi:hypothetical protein
MQQCKITHIYYIQYKNEDASWSVSDADPYVIIEKLQVSTFNTLALFIRWWEIQHIYAGLLFITAAYTWYDVPWLAK